ncbi:MAG: response regulator with CheY-like receiver domain and winged-helix DNA-binding domain [Thermoleophilia bacterium]|nr:response regulator with CheY-like receiver domain and winged-helix DNA-binding domain [Thermoleophilia bacterium]
MPAPTARVPQIVVIEDEDAIRDVVAYNLEREGYLVATAKDGRAGLQLVRDTSPDLVLLDLMLPELDGVDLCRELRADPATTAIPVIMLTARGEEADVVLGLGVGADDYVTKPFSPRELVARVQAMLRRSAVLAGAAAGDAAIDAELATDPERRRVEVGGVVVDPDRHEVLVDGAPVRLTRTELRLLHVLLRRPGRVYTREQLVERVMGDNAWITDRTIDVHVRAIRRKLGDRADVVETIRGIGYRGAAVDGA